MSDGVTTAVIVAGIVVCAGWILVCLIAAIWWAAHAV